MNKASPLISIIMPSYNSASFIHDTLQSVIEQSHENWEILISDDGSTDNTLEIVKYFNDPRVKIINREAENLGAAKSRNLSIAVAQGDYIAFLDSDDL